VQRLGQVRELQIAQLAEPGNQLVRRPRGTALARQEGVEFLFGQVPQAIEATSQGLRVRFTQEAPVATHQLVVAIGQQPAPPPWLAGLGVELEDDGRIRVDDLGRTGHPRIWAGGDNTQGPGLAVQAMAAGRRAAQDMLAARTH
jgi:glutamate synthase (NADPH/NADH) small chain